VIKKDIEKNELIVGTQKDMDLYDDTLTMKHINIL
jgi:tRNA U34 2-thiouridine synthase MnmA/TrmU